MNNWQIEFMVEFQRRRILDEIEQIQLEEIAMQARSYRPSLFGRGMFSLANWMISTGGRLRKRYEVPVAGCTHPPKGSFVS